MRSTSQNYWIRHQNDLEDQFKLDCSDDDINTNKDAKRCKKVITKLRKQTNKYFKCLKELNVVNELEVTYVNNSNLSSEVCMVKLFHFDTARSFNPVMYIVLSLVSIATILRGTLTELNLPVITVELK